METQAIQNIIEQFLIQGDLISFKGFGNGHINNTYVSTFNQAGIKIRYTHQRINKKVFKDPIGVMDNIFAVTEHLKKKIKEEGFLDPSNRTLTVVPSIEGKLYVIDTDGEYWRTYLFVENVHTYTVLDNPELAHKLGAAVGQFQNRLIDYKGPRLIDTIPRFHDMSLRYEQLDTAINLNVAGRLESVEKEIAFLKENRMRGMILSEGLKTGKLREGITHNDTKLNNILFGETSNEAQCVIDLDTVMPGTILFDVGDLIRTATITGEEDEKDISKIHFNFELFSALIKGYVSVAHKFLTDYEKSLLAESGRNITQIMAVRFITDYLNGDVYYKVKHPEHNLDRCRTQIAFIQSMDEQWKKVETFISRCFK